MSVSAQDWLNSDEQLKSQYTEEQAQQYLSLASEESLEKTIAALQGFNYNVLVAENAEEALTKIKEVIPAGASMYNAGSTTLQQIGFTEYARESEWDVIKSRMEAEEDPAKREQIRLEGITADYFVSSATAITEQGEITTCCLTGTRTVGFTSAKHLVVVAGTQKIVPDYEAAVDRTYKWSLDVESARVRVAFGVPASSVNFFSALRGNNPWGANRVTVVLIKEVLGF
eukprot:TRINITY_DN348_c0_g2_i1.p1 TRINITY_DN348_c0_g2~~TRINITY_DN348_c0_g2_i1.p1  ORF type:complete len:228 (+),score=70.41 TRINITY_DN348_c0_g2_i1:153-836(+)